MVLAWRAAPPVMPRMVAVARMRAAMPEKRVPKPAARAGVEDELGEEEAGAVEAWVLMWI